MMNTVDTNNAIGKPAQGDKLARMNELALLLTDASRAYYGENREIMPNIEYDRLYDELAELEAETGVTLAGSPTQRVGYEPASELAKEVHAAPMLSLEKTKDPAELAVWLADRDGLLSWKLDGLTIALTYDGGKLSKAVTRGDGEIGEVVTNNARNIANVPLGIPYGGDLLLRGEAIIRYSDFTKINDAIEDVDTKFKNPRNLASGSVRQLDPTVTAERRVRFYAFALVASDVKFTSREEQMRFLKTQGFETVDYRKVNAATVEGEVENFADRAARSDLPSDGLVLTFDDIAYGESLGRTAKFPRDAIAFKWADELADTTLRHIEWSASRTGLINPIAVFDPVDIEGTTVSRASVHNISIMEELALGAGDVVRVYKANMIIPQIAKNLTRSGTERPPAACPVCGAATELKDTDGVKTLRCPNPDCPAKKLKSFTHFVGRSAMNIEGLSESTLEKFISAGFIREFADIFRLSEHRDAIVEMEGLGEKSYENLIAATDAVRAKVSRVRLLNSLGIPGIGAANARVVCQAFGGDWEATTNASYDELIQVDGIGAVLADGYTKWWADERNRRMADEILSLVKLDPGEVSEKNGGAGPLGGLTFVITGSLHTYANRAELKTRIESAGGKVTDAISAKTDYLINNDIHSASSKNKNAKRLGVKIIAEAEANALLDDANPPSSTTHDEKLYAMVLRDDIIHTKDRQ
ncbi:MAG: NAD-dependent DNA ligase LigA [Clostridiales Family XIII bacterium]|jgi:DNA ligase (NAD+)|nr:NAD-dependent DNA ligase LigA [Clostridiales Family XIII bacterium]